MEEIQALLAQLKETQTELRSREQKSDARIEELTAKLEEQSKQYDELMVRMNRPHGVVTTALEQDAIKNEKRAAALFEYMRTGNDMESRSLSDVDSEGNVFVAPDLAKEIMRVAYENNEIRQKCWVGKTGSDRVRLTSMAQAKAGFGNLRPTDQDLAATKKYDTVEDLKAYITVANNTLADSYYDLASVLVNDLGKAGGVEESRACMIGTGIDEPKGIICDETLANAVVSGSVGKLGNDHASAIEFITSAVYKLPKFYAKDAVLLMNRKTEGYLNTLRDADGAKLLTKSNGVSYFDGVEIVNNEFMDDIGPGAIPIVYGNLHYYRIHDREGYSVQRLSGDEHKLAEITGFYLKARLSGGVSLPAAFIPLKCKAA
ncbi:phage major capsid protein [Pseudomonas putida]|uniref:phage major capsid protein n=1 Tax=Pseudomonas monteilii TaxID=76759 RepID=UPI001F15DF3C|nr:phage major capsid protein [Pseudomonas monteilii]EKT4476355.1 phage major capsid protein [Pseudomonas putida]